MAKVSVLLGAPEEGLPLLESLAIHGTLRAFFFRGTHVSCVENGNPKKVTTLVGLLG